MNIVCRARSRRGSPCQTCPPKRRTVSTDTDSPSHPSGYLCLSFLWLLYIIMVGGWVVRAIVCGRQ